MGSKFRKRAEKFLILLHFSLMAGTIALIATLGPKTSKPTPDTKLHGLGITVPKSGVVSSEKGSAR